MGHDGGVVWMPGELDEWSGGDPDEARLLVEATSSRRPSRDFKEELEELTRHQNKQVWIAAQDLLAALYPDEPKDEEDKDDDERSEYQEAEEQRWRDEQQAEYNQQWPELDDVQMREF